MNTTTTLSANKNLLVYINQARHILANYRRMADKLRAEIDTIRGKRHTNNVSLQIARMNAVDELERRIVAYNQRGEKIWGHVTAYQGPYINWKNVHIIEGKTYCGILELIDTSFKHSSIERYSA